MKRIIIHGLFSLGRRLAKTGMLFVILFVVFSLIFTGFIIQNSIARSKDYIRDQIGSAVEYRMDFTNLMNEGRRGAQNDTSDAENAADYEVIGIYQAVEDGFSTNTIFTSNTVIYNLLGTAGSDETNGSIVFLLDSPEHVAAFKEEAAVYLTSEYHVLYSDDTEYASLTKPLDLLSFITSILIWVVFVAGAAIILALVTIFVRDRKFEIGLLLASGEGRMKIVSQFVLEILVIAIVAFGISAIASSVTARGVSNWIVDSQLLSQNSLVTDTSTTLEMPGMMGGRNFMQSSVSLYGAVDMQSVADKSDVAVNSKVISELLLASIALVLIGSSIPLVVIMGYKPRRILQDDN